MMNFCCIKNFTHNRTNILKTKTVTYGNGSYKYGVWAPKEGKLMQQVKKDNVVPFSLFLVC